MATRGVVARSEQPWAFLRFSLYLVQVLLFIQNKNKIPEMPRIPFKCYEPLLIGGDFNIIRYANEKNTRDGVHRHTDLFNSVIHFYELREIIMTGGMFTWSNNQDFPVLEKLNRILVTKEWEDIFPQAMVKKLPGEISDHNPLILSSRICDKVPVIQFKFNLNWLKNPVFLSKSGRNMA